MNKHIFTAKLIMTLLSLSFMGAASSASPLANGSSSTPSSITEQAVIENEYTIFITIDGSRVDHLEQAYLIVAKALKIPASKISNLSDLQKALSDIKNISKDLDLTITAGSLLREKIGAQKVKALLECLNKAAESNSNLGIAYWP